MTCTVHLAESGTSAGGKPVLWSARDSVALPPFLKADVDGGSFALVDRASATIAGFRIEKQITFDLCWAAVAASAARYRKVNAPPQSKMLELYAASGQRTCPCSDHPGDDGLMLWCVDCAFKMIGLGYTELPALPGFDTLVEAMARQNPICTLRDYVAGAHYVVIVGAYLNPQGMAMVSIADPDRSQPDVRDIAYRELSEGDGRTIAWYRF